MPFIFNKRKIAPSPHDSPFIFLPFSRFTVRLPLASLDSGIYSRRNFYDQTVVDLWLRMALCNYLVVKVIVPRNFKTFGNLMVFHNVKVALIGNLILK